MGSPKNPKNSPASSFFLESHRLLAVAKPATLSVAARHRCRAPEVVVEAQRAAAWKPRKAEMHVSDASRWRAQAAGVSARHSDVCQYPGALTAAVGGVLGGLPASALPSLAAAVSLSRSRGGASPLAHLLSARWPS